MDDDVRKAFLLLDDVIQALSNLIHLNHDQIVTLTDQVVFLSEQVIALAQIIEEGSPDGAHLQ